MPILTDTSVLLAAGVQRESRHEVAAAALREHAGDGLLVPLTILTELLCFARSRYGIEQQRRMWAGLSATGLTVVPVDLPMLSLARDIDTRYSDVGFGFADCTLLATCEALRTARVLSFDRRLAAYRPSFAQSLEVLP